MDPTPKETGPKARSKWRDKMTKTYTITLANEIDARVACTKVATVGGNKAFAVAKKAAGRGAEFIRRGVDVGYRGPNGTAWMVEHRA